MRIMADAQISQEHIKSPLRFPGGKSRALEQIIPLIPHFCEYREPMVGGGSVFFRLKQMFPERRYWINDINYELYCFWKICQQNNSALIAEVSRVHKTAEDGRALFYEMLERYGIGDEFERAVRFFVLNRISFSGTVDSGGYSEQAFRGRFTPSAIRNLALADAILKGVEITNLDYETLLHASGEEVFIFLDPPYYSATQSRLYGRRGELHLQFDHERFAKAVQNCTHKWLITYDDCPEVRRRFSDYYIVQWELQYGMNNYKQPFARAGKELFIANYAISRLYHQQLTLLYEKRSPYVESHEQIPPTTD